MRRNILLLAVLLPALAFSQLNGSLLLSGRVVGENNEGVASASINIKGTGIGTIADTTGKFSLVFNQKFPFTLVITSLGYAPKELVVQNLNTESAVQLIKLSARHFIFCGKQ